MTTIKSMIRLFLILHCCLVSHVGEVVAMDDGSREEALPILVKMRMPREIQSSVKNKDILEFPELDLVIVYENQLGFSKILIYNYDETSYLGSLDFSGTIYTIWQHGKNLAIDLFSSFGFERYEYRLVRHMELLNDTQRSLTHEIASRLEWAILINPRARVLLTCQEYDHVQSMHELVRKQILPLVGKRWLLQKMPSCLF